MIQKPLKSSSDRTGWLLLFNTALALALFWALFVVKIGQTPLVLPASSEPLPDFAAIADVATRKQSFFNFVQPLAAQVNRDIMEQREQVKRWQSQWQTSGQLLESERLRIAQLASEYSVALVDSSQTGEALQQLLRKVDRIPESLVLAQAANESSWGRSRFAVEGNNLFGQWCFKVGCGIVPNNRPAEASYEVATFASPLDSVRAYMHNLNAFHLYEELRRIREELRTAQLPVTGEALAEGLLNYSTRREEYVDEIQAMIRFNRLDAE